MIMYNLFRIAVWLIIGLLLILCTVISLLLFARIGQYILPAHPRTGAAIGLALYAVGLWATFQILKKAK